MSKFIKTHDVKGGEALINTDKISIIVPSDNENGNTFMVFDSPTHYIYARETLEEIEEMLLN